MGRTQMDDRSQAREILQHYAQVFQSIDYADKNIDQEKRTNQALIDFLESTPNCFSRTHLKGHFTGSALITDLSFSKVLLTHHKKLNRWLQLGGHVDDNPNLHATAMSEAQEESGLADISFVNSGPLAGLSASMPLPFDLDYHVIPERPDVPEHMHYDVRFLMVAQNIDRIVCSDESNDLQWFDLSEAKKLTDEVSMTRQFSKLAALAAFYGH